jgi:hypothetical protein
MAGPAFHPRVTRERARGHGVQPRPIMEVASGSLGPVARIVVIVIVIVIVIVVFVIVIFVFVVL